MNDDHGSRTSWSFWIICAFALIWNIMGGINYLVQVIANDLSAYPDAARALIESRPAWATGAFAIAVFSGTLGGVLLILKKPAAFYWYVVSLLGVVVTNIHTFRVEGATEIWVGSLMSFAIAVFLVWYSKWVTSRGWLD